MSFTGIGLPITWWGGSRPTSHVMPPIRRQTLPTNAAPPPPPEIPPGPGFNKRNSIEVFQVLLRQTAGIQDIILPGFGRPKAAYFISNGNSVLGLETPNLNMSIGATDGTNQWAMDVTATDGLGNTDTGSKAITDGVILLLDAAAGAHNSIVEANFVQWLADGVRLNVSLNASSVNYPITVILFGGDSVVGASCGVPTLATEDGTVTITPGFQTNLLFTGWNLDTFSDAVIIPSILSTGFATYDGSTILQNSFFYRSEDNAAVSLVQSEVRNNGVVTIPPTRYVTLQNITATQFDLLSTGFNFSSYKVGYLALGLKKKAKVWTGIVDSPTSTGVTTLSGPPFKADVGILIAHMMAAVNTSYEGGEGSGFGYYAFGKDYEFCHSVSDEDGVTVSDVQSFNNNHLNIADDGGTKVFEGDFLGFSGRGARVNFSTTDGTVRKWPALFLKAKK